MDTKALLLELLLEKHASEPKESQFQSTHVGKVCIVRCDRSGVFYGTLESRCGHDARIRHARRLWCWAGAASLSELAVHGTCQPDQCKFPVAVDSIEVSDAIETLVMSDKAIASLNGVKIWAAK